MTYSKQPNFAEYQTVPDSNGPGVEAKTVSI